MKSALYIVDIFADIVAEMDATVYFMHGHPLDIVNQLSAKNKDATLKFQRFPLIALFQDFTETKGRTMAYNSEVSLNLIIATTTNPNYTSAQRYDNSFRTVLYPLYDEFMQKLFESCKFADLADDLIPHEKIDRLFWGKQGLYGNTGNIFNDYIDAIEIKNLNLKVKNY